MSPRIAEARQVALTGHLWQRGVFSLISGTASVAQGKRSLLPENTVSSEVPLSKWRMGCAFWALRSLGYSFRLAATALPVILTQVARWRGAGSVS